MKVHELTQHDQILIAHILSGLLASGHYTNPPNFSAKPDSPEYNPEPIRFDCGKDWKASGEPRRHPSHAVSDALDLYDELLKSNL